MQMINSHPSLFTISGQNRSIQGAISSAKPACFRTFSALPSGIEMLENANPAQKKRFIKPNKTGDPDALKICSAIGGASFGYVAVALLKRRKSCPSATTKRGQKLNVQTALILLGFAALAAVLLVAVGIDRGAKAIKRHHGEED
jgi:hypothetical protein